MRNNRKGFSLIELIVVVAIIGILAAIALPMYSKYKASAYRASAKAALVEGAQNMERFFTLNNTYAGAVVGNPATGDQVQGQTDGGKYTLTLNPAPDATSFTIRATPDFTDSCGNLTIDQRGVKLPANCW